jgi:hypothetical protein
MRYNTIYKIMFTLSDLFVIYMKWLVAWSHILCVMDSLSLSNYIWFVNLAKSP